MANYGICTALALGTGFTLYALASEQDEETQEVSAARAKELGLPSQVIPPTPSSPETTTTITNTPTTNVVEKALDSSSPSSSSSVSATSPEGNLEEKKKKKERIIVLGSGWAALSFIKQLDTSLYEVVLVSPRNYFLFTPLLPSVTVGTLEPRSVVESIRKYCKRTGSEDVVFLNAECINIDHKSNTVTCKDTSDSTDLPAFSLEYDHLVVAVGSANATFNTPGVEQYCYFLKELKDAQAIRERIMGNFELAALPGQSQEEISRLLHFVVVGGGPTGVEFAAELHDFLEEDLYKWFPSELMKNVRITIIQSAEHILNTYDTHISAYAEKKFGRDGVELRTLCRVQKVRERDIVFDDKTSKKTHVMPYGLCVWATGVGPRPLVQAFCKRIPEQTNNRAVLTDDFLKAKGTHNVYAIGDCGTMEQHKLLQKFEALFDEADLNKDGSLSFEELAVMVHKYKSEYPQLAIYARKLKDLFEEMDINKDQVLDRSEFQKLLTLVDANLKDLPQTAQVAGQQGRYLANVFNMRARGDAQELPKFQYHHLGSLAYVGQRSAVAELDGGWNFEGFLTWIMWRTAYLSKQVSWRNKFMVATDWTKELVFGRDISKTS